MGVEGRGERESGGGELGCSPTIALQLLMEFGVPPNQEKF